MKTQQFLKKLTLTLSLILPLVGVAKQSLAEYKTLGTGAELVIRTTGDQVDFNYYELTTGNFGKKPTIFGPAQGLVTRTIEKGEHIVIQNTTEKLQWVSFRPTVSADHSQMQLNFPAGLASKHEGGCEDDNGFVAEGCQNVSQDRLTGIGFLGENWRMISTDYISWFEGEEITVSVRLFVNGELIPLDSLSDDYLSLATDGLITITVAGYEPNFDPAANDAQGGPGGTVELTDTKSLHGHFIYDLDNPSTPDWIASEHKIHVSRKFGNDHEPLALRGGYEIRVYGQIGQGTFAKVSVPFPDTLAIAPTYGKTDFEKIEVWSTGESPELLRTFDAGPDEVRIHTYSGTFGVVTQGAHGFVGVDQIKNGDAAQIYYQAGAYLRITTSEVEKNEGKIAVIPVDPEDPEDGPDVAGFDFNPEGLDPEGDDTNKGVDLLEDKSQEFSGSGGSLSCSFQPGNMGFTHGILDALIFLGLLGALPLRKIFRIAKAKI